MLREPVYELEPPVELPYISVEEPPLTVKYNELEFPAVWLVDIGDTIRPVGLEGPPIPADTDTLNDPFPALLE